MTRRVVRDVLLPRSVLDTKAVVQQLVHNSLDPDRYGVWWFVEYAFKRFVVGHDLKRLPVVPDRLDKNEDARDSS